MEPKKILIFSYKLPFPLTQGGSIAQYFFLKSMVSLYEVTLCTIVNNNSQKNSLDELQKLIPNLKIVYYEKPEEKKSLIYSLCKILKKVENKISSRLIKKNVSEVIFFENVGLKFVDELFFYFFEKLIEKEKFDLIQFDFYESLALLPIVPKTIKKIIIHHEIRSKRNKLINNKKTKFNDYLIRCNEVVENSFLSLADSIVVFNEEDKFYLEKNNSRIDVSPFGIPEDLILKKEVSKEFSKFIFIGGEFHYPNKEGLEWFLDTIYLPNSKNIKWPVYIIGYWSASFVEKYSINPNIIFTGFVADLSEFYDEAVMVVPILSGSGIRTKILVSLVNKIPVFSTEFASEGLLSNNEKTNHISIFNNESEFLQNFKKATDSESLKIQADKGFNFYNENFNFNKLINIRLDVIDNVFNES